MPAGQEHANEKELSAKEWKDIIKKCRNIGIPQITFTGGEPTLRQDLVELIDSAKWFVTRLNTNGVLLTQELSKQLYEASLDSVQITLYSNNSEIHNKLVGANNFNKTIAGIKNALEAGLNVSVNTPICSMNENYKETVEFINSLGVKYVSCSGLIQTGNAKKEESKSTGLSQEALFETLKKAKEFCDVNLMEISFTSPGWISAEKLKTIGMDIPSCGACLSNMAIAPNGEVMPCQSWLSDKTSLGNILKQSWKQIWNSKKCKDIRKNSSKMNEKCPLKD